MIIELDMRGEQSKEIIAKKKLKHKKRDRQRTEGMERRNKKIYKRENENEKKKNSRVVFQMTFKRTKYAKNP